MTLNVKTVTDFGSICSGTFLQDDIIHSVTGTEVYSSAVNLHNDIASEVSVSQSLVFSTITNGAGKIKASSLEEAVSMLSSKEKLDLQVGLVGGDFFWDLGF